MKFLEVFNEIEKGNYALTDEAVYSSIQNGDELIPLYGGNKSHRVTDRKISVSAKTKKGLPITIFSGEGIIISLDGSAGSMTYKSGEKFSLNHHAGFITLRDDAKEKVNLEFFATYMQDYYRNLSVSDGSKTLSLTQIYCVEFELPPYDVQCNTLNMLKKVSSKVDQLLRFRTKLMQIVEKEFSIEYKEYQAKSIPISICIDYMSGNSGLTEEFIYQTLQHKDVLYDVLSSATEERTMMGKVPMCDINGSPLKVFENKAGLLVTRNGKAGQTRYLDPGKYTINDHAYILFQKDSSPYSIDLRWLAIQYRKSFLSYSSSADNGTWNMTGFFKYTVIDIPELKEQQNLVQSVERIWRVMSRIDQILLKYNALLEKEISLKN